MVADGTDGVIDANNGNNGNEPLISATLVDEQEVFVATQVMEDDYAEAPPDSEVERIVSRLELRNANRVAVPLEVKRHFLRLCNEVCEKSGEFYIIMMGAFFFFRLRAGYIEL